MAGNIRTIAKERELWQWANPAKDKWVLTFIPQGELHAPWIKQLSTNSDGTTNFAVYRNGKALGAPKTLDEAKKRAQAGKIPDKVLDSHKRIVAYVNGNTRDAVAFGKLTAAEQSDIANAYPWAMPRKSDLEAKGVKTKAVVVRTDLLSKNEKKAADMALPVDSKIERIKDGNPKREGSDAWGRWEIMFGHCGGTVGTYIKNHGNPTTLKNAVKMGYVKVKGMSA